ncbi:MAG: PIN-like domain-containing protein [Eubacteriales bacterium]
MAVDIKRLIDKNYIVICDTNVYLHIYRYSPEFSDFALRCMQAIRPMIVLPSTVKYEFLKHYRPYFSDMEKRVRRVVDDTKSQINNAARKVLKICDNLQALQYPDITDLKDGLSKKFDELLELSESFFEDRTLLNFIANPWAGKNLVYELIEQIINNYQIMADVTQEEIYQICEEGEKRYKTDPQTPPGFKDAKSKDGIRKYSDLIMWKEILRYSKTYNANVIFVTDDTKSDWWVDDNGQKVFHPYLHAEFERETGKKIISLPSINLFADASISYGIPQSDAVEIALRITDADYFERVYNPIFDNITDALSFSGEDYIEPSSHIGTNGIDELEITDHEFVSAKQVNRDQHTITYVFTFKVEADATSFDYWGKDDETKEILLGPAGSHTFEGEIYVEVTREADIYLDFEADDGFENAKILDGHLVETNYQPLFDDNEENLEGAYDTCPDCGCQINFENDGGNGFCIMCAPNH